jgi:hypothetical protein
MLHDRLGSPPGPAGAGINAQGAFQVKTVVTEFISLDGVVQAPNPTPEDTASGFAHGGWMAKYFDADVMGGTFGELAAQSDALLQGRRAYLVSASAWPGQSGFPFADWINRVGGQEG